MRRELSLQPGSTVASDQLGVMLEKLIDWPLVMRLIEKNAAFFDNGPSMNAEQKSIFIARYTNIVLLIPGLRAALSDGVILLRRGGEPRPYCLTEDEMNQAHEKFQMHFLRLNTSLTSSLFDGPRQNVADLAGGNTSSRKRALDGGDAIVSDFKRLEV